jgi:hypothetical protein
MQIHPSTLAKAFFLYPHRFFAQQEKAPSFSWALGVEQRIKLGPASSGRTNNSEYDECKLLFFL